MTTKRGLMSRLSAVSCLHNLIEAETVDIGFERYPDGKVIGHLECEF
jgi:hypothetical protein